jgi:hypothetical protein
MKRAVLLIVEFANIIYHLQSRSIGIAAHLS